jgi:hypothetical protein
MQALQLPLLNVVMLPCTEMQRQHMAGSATALDDVVLQVAGLCLFFYCCTEFKVDVCKDKPCDSIQHAVKGSCGAAAGGGAAFNCSCETGYDWISSNTSCLSKQHANL